MTAAIGPVDTTSLDTWPRLLQHNASRFEGHGKAMRYKHYGIWQSYSWADYYSNVKYLALGLLDLGFRPGSKLLIVGDNCPEWYFAELAAQSNRGVSVGLYSDLAAGEVEYIARDCEADFAMVEDQEQVDKILQIRERLPDLKKVVYWRYKGMSGQDSDLFIGLRSVVRLGRSYETEHPGVFEENVAAGGADDVCAIVYTSGATRDAPKGTLQSYRSLLTNARYYAEGDRLGPSDDLACALPPAWIAEQWLAFGCHLLCGGTVNFPENSETLQEDIREIAPSVAVYNTRLWESQTGQVQSKLRSAGRFKRSVSGWMMPIGAKAADLHYRIENPPLSHRLNALFANLLMWRPIRDSLGLPRTRVCYTSGSTLSPEALRFFHSLKTPLKNLYGSAEAGAITGAGDQIQSPGTVGSFNPGIEVKYGDQGEILVRHPGVFVGYYNDPQLTAEVLDDGWVRTGDSGRTNDSGELVFVDRVEDLIILTDGCSLAPQQIESRLKHSPYIKDAWVLAGRDCRYVSAVIIVDADATGQWADKGNVMYTTFGDLSQKAEVYELISKEIAAVNHELPAGERIAKYVNLHKEFDPDESELTRNRKLRRAFLLRRYADLIAALNEGNASVEVDTEFTYQDGRTSTIRTALRIASVERGD